MLRNIRPDQVQIGMYIAGFDGSWISHPFWRAHFLVASESDLARIRESAVRGVLIDEARGVPLEPRRMAAEPPAPAHAAPQAARRAPPPAPAAAPTDDVAAARAVMLRSKKVMRHVFDGARLGRAVESRAVMAVVDDISASVSRNAHALIGVTRLKSKHEYTYLHSVAVCTLMIHLAREIGLAEHRVRDLGLAGLLHDIGKMGVSEAVLDKPGRLDDLEFAQVRSHPELGYALLKQGTDVPDAAFDVCLHHHEKMDGTGYPRGLSGSAISLEARMGAICDVYDALTSNRAYKEAWTPADAIAAMWGWQGHFDPELLFRFMQSILVFPVGMLVRLRSNRLAVVLPRKRTALKVRAFLDARAHARLTPTTVTISSSFTDDQIVGVERPEEWGIADWPVLRDHLLGEPSAARAAA